jgi:hypothetical protein
MTVLPVMGAGGQIAAAMLTLLPAALRRLHDDRIHAP